MNIHGRDGAPEGHRQPLCPGAGGQRAGIPVVDNRGRSSANSWTVLSRKAVRVASNAVRGSVRTGALRARCRTRHRHPAVSTRRRQRCVGHISTVWWVPLVRLTGPHAQHGERSDQIGAVLGNARPGRSPDLVPPGDALSPCHEGGADTG